MSKTSAAAVVHQVVRFVTLRDLRRFSLLHQLEGAPPSPLGEVGRPVDALLELGQEGAQGQPCARGAAASTVSPGTAPVAALLRQLAPPVGLLLATGKQKDR